MWLLPYGERADELADDDLDTVGKVTELCLPQRQGIGVRSVEMAALEWVSWFNHQRLMGPLGHIPPAEAEANYYGQLNRQTAIAA